MSIPNTSKNSQYHFAAPIFLSINCFHFISAIIIRDSTQLFNHIINHQLTSNNRINSPEILSIPDSFYGKPLYKPDVTSGLFNQGYSFNQFDDLQPIGELQYIVDGRVLKQYLVMEDHGEDNSIEALLNNPFSRNAITPFLPPNFNNIKPVRPNFNFPAQHIPINPNLQRNDGTAPVALGSGALGYIRLANGAIYIGSGSLGYINDQQRSDEISQIKNRQGHEPSPLTFGHNPN